jgi:hypothetical protein
MSGDGYRFRHCGACDLIRLCAPHGDGWLCELCRGKGLVPEPDPAPTVPEPAPAPAPAPVDTSPDAPGGALFLRGELGERASTADADHSAVEHATLPEAVQKEKEIVLVLSFDTDEERDALVKLLGTPVVRRGTGPWETVYPAPEEDGISQLFDVDGLVA